MLFVLLASGQLRPRLTSLHAVDAYLDLGIDAFGRYEGPGHTGEGLLIFPKNQLALCIIPKAGSTTLKWIAMVLLGGPPSSVCGCQSSPWGCLEGFAASRLHNALMRRTQT